MINVGSSTIDEIYIGSTKIKEAYVGDLLVYPIIKRTKIRIDQTITDPEAMITRIVDLGGIEAIRANSHRYTGTFADGKMTLKQLDDVNGTKYADGTAADLTTIGTDVWMKLPQFHWKCTEYATDVWDFEVVYGAKPNDTYKTWDGNDLIGVYEAYIGPSNFMYSVSDKASSSNASQYGFKTYAQARGEGFSLVKWKHHCMMAMLYYTQYGNTNCQAKIGKGTNSDKSTGITNSLGMTDTVAGGNGDSNSINFWGLENWWGNKYEWMDNIVVDSYVWKVTEDDGTVRTAGTGGSGIGYISKMLFGENMDLIPTDAFGSTTTGFCDYYYPSSDNSLVAVRSSNNAYSEGGVAYVLAYHASSYTNSPFGSRLAFRGECEILPIIPHKGTLTPTNGIWIQDIDGYFHTEDEWDGTYTANCVAVISLNGSFGIELTESPNNYLWGFQEYSYISSMPVYITRRTAISDWQGNKNTGIIVSILNGGAAQYCQSFVFPDGTRGFLPACGQLYYVFENKQSINKALLKAGGTIFGSDVYWTSTYYGRNYADDQQSWVIALGDGSVSALGIDYSMNVRVFKQL